jgi:hypothetical protein
MYIMLSGFPPFYGENDVEIFKAIQKSTFRFLSPEWDTIRYLCTIITTNYSNQQFNAMMFK